MILFEIVLILAGAFYALMICAFAVGFQRVRKQTYPSLSADIPFVSVIVPARDEGVFIKTCIDTIRANDYPPDRYEIIVVDDLSEDDTAEIVREIVSAQEPQFAPVRLLQMPENLERTRAHKKRAIEKGISEAEGAIILTTDADCHVSTQWIRSMAGCFPDLQSPLTQPVTAFVSGPVLFRAGDHPLLHMQALEFLGLVSVGAGAIGAGRPTICNGANVAYRKDLFAKLGGFSGIDHLTSGDDELLMQKIADTTPHHVRFNAEETAAVVTEPIHSFREFFQQRKRWASKGAHYPNKGLIAMLLTVYLFYFGLLSGLVALTFFPAIWLAVMIGLGLKLIPEALLLWPACRHFNRNWLFAYFLPEQLLHIPYIVVLGAAGALGKYEWKGRQIER